MAMVLVRISLAFARPLAHFGSRIGVALARLLMRLAKIGVIALLAGIVVFALDMLLVRDEGRPGGP